MNSDALTRVSEKLKDMTESYDRLKLVRADLRSAQAAKADQSNLVAEVKFLERRCRKALNELQDAYASMKGSEPPSGL